MAEALTRPPRDQAELEAVEGAILQSVLMLGSTQRRVAMAYSGGAESGLLLHLLREARPWLTVLHVDPGILPHEAEHVRRQAGDWPHFVRIASDREAAWRVQGMPSLVVPVAHDPISQGDVPSPLPAICNTLACCARVRWQPMMEWCRRNAVSTLIHGQRRGEGSNLFAPGVEAGFFAPLAGWSREEVMQRVAHHGVPLPEQYREGYPTTIECGVCPANLLPDRMAYLRRRYPEHHAEALRLAREVYGAADHALAKVRAEMEAAA